jgi:hypothetical protein
LTFIFRKIFEEHKLNFVKQMLEKNELSNNWVDTLIALSNLVICELSPDLSTDSDNMSICQYVLYFYIIIFIFIK